MEPPANNSPDANSADTADSTAADETRPSGETGADDESPSVAKPDDAKYEGNLPELTADEFPLDRYEPITIIGKGTVGTIYLCQDRRLHKKKVAVKVLRAVPDKELIAFQQEARATSRLNHRNIIAVYDFGTTNNGVAFMAMEYVEGVSLDRLIRTEGPLDPDRALKIAVCIADALAYAHSCGIFHRDIKTSNILLVHSDSREPEVRLIDFGVAAIQRSPEEHIKVQGRTIVGTPQYMSPDQCFGLSYDERSEIYSLGCVLFEMLTGKPPFQGDTALQIIAKHANETPPTLSAAHGFWTFNNRMEGLVSRCLAKNREDRYQSMYNLKVDLVKVIDRAFSITLDNLVVQPGEASSKHHDRDPILNGIMIALVCFSAASWLAYLQVERFLFKNTAPPVASVQRKVDLSLPSLDEYTASPGFIRTYNYGRLVIQANHQITDEDMKSLSTERDINELKLLAPVLNGSGFRYLGSASLNGLVVKNGTLSDDCLKNMGELKSLKRIAFMSCKGFTNRGIEYLQALPIENFSVPDCDLSNDALQTISHFRALDNLDFADNHKVDAATLAAVGENTQLQFLSISPEQLDLKCFETLAENKKLQAITFSGSRRMTERELLALKDLPNLHKITFGGNCGSPQALKVLTQFPQLTRLELNGIAYGDEHMAALDGVKVNHLVLTNTDVTKKGFMHVLKMPKLQRLNLKHCSRIPLTSVTDLSKRLKTCDIVVL